MSILKLYDSAKEDTRSIASGIQYDNLKIEKELASGDMTLTLSWIGDYVPDYVMVEGYIETKEQWYVIKEISGNYITAKLNLEGLETTVFDRYTAGNATIQEAAKAALADTGWTVKSTIEKRRSVQQFKKNPLEIVYKIRDAWMCEVAFDTKNKTITFSDKIGEQRCGYFIIGLNLDSVEKTSDTYDLYTRIIPVGKDGLDITKVNPTGEKYIDNFTYTEKIKTLYWEDASYEDAQVLYADACAKLKDLSRPKLSYACKVSDLAAQDEKYDALRFDIGDTVQILSKPNNVKDSQRIVKLTQYPDKPDSNTVELASTVLTWEEMQKQQKAAADAWEDISASDGTINGYYVHGVQANGIVGVEVLVNGEVVEENKNLGYITINGSNNSLMSYLNQSIVPATATETEKYMYQLEGDLIIDGTLSAKKVNVDDLLAFKATIGGWGIEEGKIYATAGGKTCAVQSGNVWAFAAGGKSHASYADCPFRVDHNGNLYAENIYVKDTLTMYVTADQTTPVLNVTYYNDTIGYYTVNVGQRAASIELGNLDKTVTDAVFVNGGRFQVNSEFSIMQNLSTQSVDVSGLIDAHSGIKLYGATDSYNPTIDCYMSDGTMRTRLTADGAGSLCVHGSSISTIKAGWGGLNGNASLRVVNTASDMGVNLSTANNGGLYDFKNGGWLIRFSNCNSTASNQECLIPSVYKQTGTGTAVVVNSSGKVMRQSSSKRYKKQIEDLSADIARKFYGLPVRSFKYREGQLDKADELYDKAIPGLIAEEVAEILDTAAVHDDQGRPEMWNSMVIVPIMLKLIQDLNKRLSMVEEGVNNG